MSALTEIVWIVLRELRKSFRSTKGIALSVITLLVALSATLILAKVNQLTREKIPADVPLEEVNNQLQQAAGQLYEQMYNVDVAQALHGAPITLFFIFLPTIWLSPLMVAILGFDTVSAETQYKSVRYWTNRVRRTSYYLGKFFGLWSTVSLLTFVMSFLIWIVCIVRGVCTVSEIASWGLRFWLMTLPISAAWCGFAILIGSLFNSPMVSLIAIVASFFVIWVTWLIGSATNSLPLLHLYPNHYDRYLLLSSSIGIAKGIGGCLALATASVAAGALRFKMRDI